MGAVEKNIKEMIIGRYGSLKKFCETINMPWTTLDSILKRVIVNSNMTNVMKITKELKIDTECLASGMILDSTKSDIAHRNAEIEESPKIIQYYGMLNDRGKYEATKRVEELTNLPQYVSPDTPEYLKPKAARNDYEKEPGQAEKMLEDISSLKRPK